MERSRFVIEASEAESMAEKAGMTVMQLLPSLVESAQKLARPSISNYHVGAVGLGSTGRIYVGVNVEFPGLPLHHSIHAEQFLVTNLSLHAETHLRCLAVSDAPCGHCRQFFQEIRDATDIKVLITSGPDQDFRPLTELLPNRFGPDDLLDKDVPLLLEPHNNGLSLLDAIDFQLMSTGCNGACACDQDKLKYEALEAANKSHAPYSGCPSGVAIMDSEGRVYRGSYMESAAYNPSLGPVQAALVAFIAGGGGGYEEIVGAVLVEKEGAVVKQEQTARLLMNLVSPKCEFRVFYCSSGSKKV